MGTNLLLVALQINKWQVSLYPLRVLYTPTLRLRYRVTWDREARAFNRNLGESVFREPELAETSLQTDPGTVIIKDGGSNDFDPHVFVNFEAGKAISAVVQLPLNEKDPEECSLVVKKAIYLLFDT